MISWRGFQASVVRKWMLFLSTRLGAYSRREGLVRPRHPSSVTDLSYPSRGIDCVRDGLEHPKNGELLATGEAQGFEILVTTDTSLKYQQNLQIRKIGIVVLLSTSWPKIRQRVDAVIVAVDGARSGSYTEMPQGMGRRSSYRLSRLWSAAEPGISLRSFLHHGRRGRSCRARLRDVPAFLGVDDAGATTLTGT